MKAAVLVAPEQLEIRDVEKPTPGPGEVLIRTAYCGICTLEQRLFSGERKIFYPIVPGHEASGFVEEVGPQVQSDLAPGMPVALDLVTRCGECYYCRIGLSNMCLNRYRNGNRVLGGFAQYITVKARQVFTLPPGLSLAQAAFAEPVACCIRSLKKIGVGLAEDLLIIGAGPMGQMHLQTALCLGARVFVSDPDRRRLATAERFGAYLTVDPTSQDLAAIVRQHTGGRGVDACVLASTARAGLQSAVEAINKNGRLNIYTSYSDRPPLPIDADTLHRTEQLITGSEGRTEHDFLQAVRLISFGKVRVEPLISLKVPLKRLAEGIRAAMTHETYRVLLELEAGP